jgi:hypothetical protein
VNRTPEDRAPHGTEACARRHYRLGHKPLRQFCPVCAEASCLAKVIRAERRRKRREEQLAA